MRISVSPNPQHHLLHTGLRARTHTQICTYIHIFILVAVKWYLTVVLICISIMTNDVKHLFTCLFHPSLHVCSNPLLILKVRLSFYCWVIRALYIFLMLDPSQICFANIFCTVGCLLILLIMSVNAQNFLIWMKSHLFFFCCLCSWCHILESIAKLKVMKIYLMFSSKSFTVLVLVFRLLIHFESIFLYGMK